MIYDRPYFMENEEWFVYDKETNTYSLTDKAPPEVVESYNEFLELLKYNPFWGLTQEDFDNFVEFEYQQIQREKADNKKD